MKCVRRAAGTNQAGGSALSGGLVLAAGNATMVNSTVAKNTVTGGAGAGDAAQGIAAGGGTSVNDTATVILDNNTITQNTISGGTNSGAGVLVGTPFSGGGTVNPTLLNNLIQGNQSIGSSANDLDVTTGTPLDNATNNFISTISNNAVSTTANIVGNNQAQLGSVVGVDSKGNPTGGPIYYPLLANAASIGAGTTSDLSTIASVEGTTTAASSDEIGNPRSNNGFIDLGAVQNQIPSAPTVTINPTNQTVTAGSTATFTASASGNPTPSVQWQISTDGGKTFSNLSGATSTILTLTKVSPTMSGEKFQALFTNSAGTVASTAATLTVQATQTAPAFTNTNNAAFTVGQEGNFLVTTSGSPAPTLTLSGALPSGVTFTDYGNGTAALAGTPAAGTQGTYNLTIMANNGVGSAVTQTFTLTVNPTTVPPSPPQPPTLHVPPLLALINEFLNGVETVNANGTETVTYPLFGFTLITATYDASGNFVSGSLLGFPIPNWIWFV